DIVAAVGARQFLITCDSGPFRRKCFPALAATHSALDRRARPDSHVTEFTYRAALAAIDLPIENDTRTHPFFNQNQNKIANFADFGPTKPQLRESRSVGIIINGHGKRSRLRQRFGYRSVAPIEMRDICVSS